MKKLFILGVLVIGTMSSWAQKQDLTYLAYIEEWKAIAIQEQQDYGIPASITMAQALLESQAGQSELALNAKNHFGIKCTNE
jgi:flagellum-specific peptidoglycan hydrolase FlgJ